MALFIEVNDIDKRCPVIINLDTVMEIAPIFNNLKCIDKIWAVPRSRGKINFFELLPFIKALRQCNFDRAVDFGGNDRGALFSLLSGSKIRLGLVENRPKFLQKICYTSRIDSYSLPKNYVQKNLSLLSTWNIRKLNHIQPKIVANINLRKQAKEILSTVEKHYGKEAASDVQHHTNHAFSHDNSSGPAGSAGTHTAFAAKHLDGKGSAKHKEYVARLNHHGYETGSDTGMHTND